MLWHKENLKGSVANRYALKVKLYGNLWAEEITPYGDTERDKE